MLSRDVANVYVGLGDELHKDFGLKNMLAVSWYFVVHIKSIEKGQDTFETSTPYQTQAECLEAVDDWLETVTLSLITCVR